MKTRLRIKLSKCKFEKQKITFLRYRIEWLEIRSMEKKLQILIEWKKPTKKKEIQAFLGFVNYYQKFVFQIVQLMKPFIDLTKQSVIWKWEKKEARIFKEIKNKLEKDQLLQIYDSNEKIWIEIDISEHTIARMISQKGQSIEFRSSKLNPTEQNYIIMKKKMLTVIQTVKKWRKYLKENNEKTTIAIDHKNLEYFQIVKITNRRQAR